MSLRFVFGGSGAGKSTGIFTEVLQRAKETPQQNFLIIVPDQFTMQTQKELVLHPANDRGGILNIDVLSFGRLSHRIFEEVGKKEIPVLDDTGKSLVLLRVAGSLSEKLPFLGAHLDRQGYIHEVKSAISEFLQYGISVEDVGKMAEIAGKRGALCAKLKDLQVLYEGFLCYIRDKYITTEETLDRLCEALYRSQIVRHSVVVFDGFTGFTPIQNRVIAALMELADEVILTVTMDERENPFAPDGEQRLFHLGKKTVHDLLKMAEERGIARGKDVFADYSGMHRFRDNAPLMHLEHNLFRCPLTPYAGETEGKIRLFAASTIREEIRQTAIAIRRLVMEKGYQYRDFAVITGNLESYAGLIQSEFAGQEIPCYVDETKGLLLNPLIEYIKSAYGILEDNFSYESVFRYLRTGLADFTPEEVDAFENYCVRTGLRGKKRYAQKLVRKTQDMQGNEEALARMEALRQRLMAELSPFFAQEENTAAAHVRTLYAFLTNNRAEQKMAVYQEMFQRQKDYSREREYAQSYRLVMDLLEQIIGLLHEESLSRKDFQDILEAGFLEIEVGTIPQNVDRLLVGDMERTRLKEIKVLFFLGVNDGNIPRNASKGGLISDIDREFLAQSSIELAPSPRQQMFIQRLYLYLNLTKPTDMLFISYAKADGEGRALRPAYLIRMLQQIFPDLGVELPQLQNSEEQIYTPRGGISYLAKALREYAQGSAEAPIPLYMAYLEYSDGAETPPEASSDAVSADIANPVRYKELLKMLTEAAFYRYEQQTLPAGVARALYGEMLIGSISRLETFAACAYRHFLRYGLQLREKEEFSFEAVDMGNVFHGVLQGFSEKLEESPYTWFNFPEEFAERTVTDVLSLFAAGYGNTVLYDSARSAYAVERMGRILKRTVKTLQYQLQKGDFVPKDYEVAFSSVTELDKVDITLSEQEKMRLVGRIDRVDVCERDEKLFVKIVDYKSGSRKFDLAALYYGLQLQLVVYMNEAVAKKSREYPDRQVLPAAMLYYHVTDPVAENEQGADKAPLTPEEVNEKLVAQLRMGGMVQAQEEILRTLDRESAGKSDVVPVEWKKDGTLSMRSSVLTGEEMSQISRFVSAKVKSLGERIMGGEIGLLPYKKGEENACTYCAYRQVCGFDENLPGVAFRNLSALDKEQVFSKMKDQLSEEK